MHCLSDIHDIIWYTSTIFKKYFTGKGNEKLDYGLLLGDVYHNISSPLLLLEIRNNIFDFNTEIRVIYIDSTIPYGREQEMNNDWNG